MYLNRSMRSLYLEVFSRNYNAMTLRYFGTAPCAETILVGSDVFNKSVNAGSEMTSSLHMKSRPSIARQYDEK